MSPNEVKMTSGRRAMAIARSIISSGVTQTGQPGPWTSVTDGGSISSIPNRISVCVCPPQISISVQGRVTMPRIDAANFRDRFPVPVLVDEAHARDSVSPSLPAAG